MRVEKWDILMHKLLVEKKEKELKEKRFAGKKELDKDGDGVPKWADKDDSDPKVGSKGSKKKKGGKIPPQLRMHIKKKKKSKLNETIEKLEKILLEQHDDFEESDEEDWTDEDQEDYEATVDFDERHDEEEPEEEPEEDEDFDEDLYDDDELETTADFDEDFDDEDEPEVDEDFDEDFDDEEELQESDGQQKTPEQKLADIKEYLDHINEIKNEAKTRFKRFQHLDRTGELNEENYTEIKNIANFLFQSFNRIGNSVVMALENYPEQTDLKEVVMSPEKRHHLSHGDVGDDEEHHHKNKDKFVRTDFEWEEEDYPFEDEEEDEDDYVKTDFEWDEEEHIEEDVEYLTEAEVKKKKPRLGKVTRNPSGSKKKFHVYVKCGGRVKKISFGDPGLSIKRDSAARRKNFRARHKCDKPAGKDRCTARYWSCYQWRAGKKVEGEE